MEADPFAVHPLEADQVQAVLEELQTEQVVGQELGIVELRGPRTEPEQPGPLEARREPEPLERPERHTEPALPEPEPEPEPREPREHWG